MVAPIQQEILQRQDIDVMTLCTVEKVSGDEGDFSITLNKKPRYVSLEACIGCGACYEPCPVSLKNEWEENLSEKKAIYVPCAGALPNVPVIDAEHCLNLSGKKSCKACQEACMFGAIDFSEKAEKVQIHAGAVIIATGFDILDTKRFANLGYGKFKGVYTSMEFERLYASNGPTSGELILRDGEKTPKSVAIVHCVGRRERGYCSGVCCMSSFKHAIFIKHKLPDADVYEFHSDICVPGKRSQEFFRRAKDEGVNFIFQPDPESLDVRENGAGLEITYKREDGREERISVDMVILESAVVPDESTPEIAKIFGIEQDERGFFKTSDQIMDSVETSRPGIFVAGCAEGPKDAQMAVIQAESAVGKVMNCLMVNEKT